MTGVRPLAAALAVLCLTHTLAGAAPRDGTLGGIVTVEGDRRGYTVQLIDAGGREVASSAVTADGEYRFDRVSPGRYALGIGNSQGQRAPVAAPPVVVEPGAAVRRDLALIAVTPDERDRVVGLDPSLGSWWTSLTAPAKTWAVLAILVASWFLYDALTDDDNAEIVASPS